MNNQALSVYLSIYDFGSFSMAAQQQHMTQPAVSAVISALEDEIGQPLFIRKRGQRSRIVPTEAGIIFAEYARKHLKDYRQLRIDLARNEEFPSLNFSCSPTPSAYLAPILLNEFNKSFPQIQVKFSGVMRDEVFRKIESNKLDLAITAGSSSSKLLIYEKLLRDPLVLIYPKEISMPTEFTPKSLLKYPLIIRTRSSHLNTLLVNYLKTAKLSLEQMNIVAEASSNVEIFKAVAHGRGIGFIPQLIYLSETTGKNTSVAAVPNVELDRYIFLVRHKNRPLSTSAEVFWNYALGLTWCPPFLT